MRPSSYLLLLVLALLAIDSFLFCSWKASEAAHSIRTGQQQKIVAALGLTDLCVATEARYTRHPAVTDPVAPFMDHLGAMEHFPSGSFWLPVAPNAIASSN